MQAPSPTQQSQSSSEASSYKHQPYTTPNDSRVTVPSACLACRSKHLKCDGSSPCSRCITHGFECSYVRSRRGYKGPRRASKQADAVAGMIRGGECLLPGEQTNRQSVQDCPPTRVDHPAQASPDPMQPGALDGLGVPQFLVASPAGSTNSSLVLVPQESQQGQLLWGQLPGPSSTLSASIRERCIEAFFYYFYAAHPFLLPKALFLETLKTKSLRHLEIAVRYIGSRYVAQAPTAVIGQEVSYLLASRDCPRDGFTVQTLLLLAICFDGDTEQNRALELLRQAQDLALELGMHRREFAATYGEGSPVLEESWRRTWWELYVVDGMIAGVHQQSSFRLDEVLSSVLLPCEEQEYMSGRIPTPHSIDELDDESFEFGDVIFSSFAYRITAVRNLGRALRFQHTTFQDDPILDNVDTHLVNWTLHLPPNKQLSIDKTGQIDEMLFQAQMITNGSLILLHRPHSQLDTSVVRNVTSCAPHKQVSPGQTHNIHAAKIIQAAENISRLITLPVPLIKHTHFFVCVITLASIVHLSHWAALLPCSHDDNLKQQIRLSTGALKALAEVWPSAQKTGQQVKAVAQGVFSSRKLAAQEGFWSDFTEEEMIQSIIEDEVIFSGVQLA